MHAASLVFEISRAVNRSFEDVMREREQQVMRIAFRMLGNWPDAEDVAQETFFRLHRHGMSFESDQAMASWICRVATNLCLDRLRSRKPVSELSDIASGESSAEASVLRDEQKRSLMTALGCLPEKQRAAVTLREIEGLSTAEVAAVLGSSEGTVRSHVSTALVRLRELMSRRSR